MCPKRVDRKKALPGHRMATKMHANEFQLRPNCTEHRGVARRDSGLVGGTTIGGDFQAFLLTGDDIVVASVVNLRKFLALL